MTKKKILAPLKVKLKVGAPNKPRDEKKDPNTGLTQFQKDWVQKEADGRGVSRTDIMREAMEMYMTALESQRDILPIDEIVDSKK